MSRTAILAPLIRITTAALLSVGLLSPARAAPDVFPDVAAGTTTERVVPTSRLPWLAPVGHRQPHVAEAPRSEAVSAWERQQQQLDQELDRKLIICRGC